MKLRCRLERLYWPYQLAFAIAQVCSAVFAAALFASVPSVTRALWIVLPPLLALASLMVRGPIEKIGLVIEAEWLTVAGRRIPFSEIVRVVEDYSARPVESEDSMQWMMHVWTLRLQLLVGSVEVYRAHRELPIPRCLAPLPKDRYCAFMAREIRMARVAWFSSLTPSQLADLRRDLLEFQRYRPAHPWWQEAMAKQRFSLLALGVAAVAWFASVAWYAPSKHTHSTRSVPIVDTPSQFGVVR